MKLRFLNHTTQWVALAMGLFFLASCNKDELDGVPLKAPSASGETIARLLDDASFSLLKLAATKAGMMETLADSSAVYTLFAPDDAALTRSGITAGVIAALPATQIASILQYHLVGGQRLGSSAIPTSFPNLQLPTELVLAPPSASLPPGLRMPVFPSMRPTAAYVNNVPLTVVDIQASNGVIHKTAAVLLPPTVMLWDRISADGNLTYLKAAIQRADSGAAAGTTLQGFLSNPAANFTVFAPNDAAFKQLLIGQITLALVAKGIPPANAQAAASALISIHGTTVLLNPSSLPDAPIFPPGTGIGNQLAGVLTPTTVKGLVVYHLFGTRAFSVNLPSTATAFQTLLNSAVPAHPGVTVQATFGATGVTAATVKGLANATASNILINPTPGSGTSDQLCVNGIMHIIDQVLRPQ